jgi:transketolase
MHFEQLNHSQKNSEQSQRAVFGKTLVELGKIHPNLVVLDADLSSSTKTDLFARAFPARFINVGIAEQNMIGIAIGLADAGKIPIVSGFTCFTLSRGWDMIRAAASDHHPVKLCTTHAGLSPDLDGGSHQALEDLALMGTIPDIEIYCPADPREIRPMLDQMLVYRGVSYLRLMRNPLPGLWTESNFPDNYSPTQPHLIYETHGDMVDITLFSTGSMSCYFPPIISQLQNAQKSVRCIHLGKIRPLSPKSLLPFWEKSKSIVTLEEHNVAAGFGAQLARIISQRHAIRILNIGIHDRVGQTGTIPELFDAYQLSPEKIANRILEWIH